MLQSADESIFRDENAGSFQAYAFPQHCPDARRTFPSIEFGVATREQSEALSSSTLC
jgi:hypothetical protein